MAIEDTVLSDPEVLVIRLETFERALLAAAGADPNANRADDRSATMMGILLGKAMARQYQFERMTEVVCGIEIGPSFMGLEALLEALLDMVDDEGRFEWKPRRLGS